MDEEKLKEDDWMKEIGRSIGEQIDRDDKEEDSDLKNKSNHIDSKSKEKENREEQLKENKTEEKLHKANVPVVDQNTAVEKASLEEEEPKKEERPDEQSGQGSIADTEKGNKEDDGPAIASEEETISGEEAVALESYLENAQVEAEKKKGSWKKKLLIVLCVIGGLLGVACIFIYYSLNQIDRERPEDIKRLESDLTPSELAAQQSTLKPQQFDNVIEQKVVNILLIGEEAINDGKNGRSDSMMIATLNTVEKTIKLTSLMRDMYVTIPGYRDNKLNSAYHSGGGVLLAETIEQNFGIEIDGYVRVNFDAFEKIVDKLGGVDITLTEAEAHYLNTTNYISKKKYRCVKEGLNTLNGNQALGYCRVRYKGASNGEINDFGRTYRQRTVIKTIFDKYKNQNIVNMISIANELLSYVTTNMSKSEMISYLTTAAGFGKLEMEVFRIPLDNSYEDQKIDGPGWVLVIDFEKNKKALRDFIYAGIAETDIKVESGDMEDEKYFSYLWTD